MSADPSRETLELKGGVSEMATFFWIIRMDDVLAVSGAQSTQRNAMETVADIRRGDDETISTDVGISVFGVTRFIRLRENSPKARGIIVALCEGVDSNRKVTAKHERVTYKVFHRL